MKIHTHERITAYALDTYIECFDTNLTRLLKINNFRQCVIDGSIWEDAPSIPRLLNWHFYQANDLLKPKLWWIVDPTSKKQLEHRQKELLKEVNHGVSERLFTHFGRTLHHIQDMSTPSHVLPIYHGPDINDPYETYLIGHWDRISPDMDTCSDHLDKYLIACPKSFTDLYEYSAQTSLRKLDPENRFIEILIDGTQSTTDASIFWKPYDQVDDEHPPYHKNGFGCFGILGQYYGNTNQIISGQHRYQVKEDVYQSIAAHFVKKSVVETLLAINILDSKLTRNSDPII